MYSSAAAPAEVEEAPQRLSVLHLGQGRQTGAENALVSSHGRVDAPGEVGASETSALRPLGRFRRLLWLVSLAVIGGLGVTYFAWPGHHLLLWTPLGLSAVVSTLAGVRAL